MEQYQKPILYDQIEISEQGELVPETFDAIIVAIFVVLWPEILSTMPKPEFDTLGMLGKDNRDDSKAMYFTLFTPRTLEEIKKAQAAVDEVRNRKADKVQPPKVD